MLNINEIHELIKRIDESSIDEFSFETNETKLSLKKHKGEAEVAQTNNPVVTSSTTSVEKSTKEVDDHTSIKEDAVSEKESEATKNYDHEIVSPMVGTFYSSPSPDKDSFVKTGEKVNPDTVVCIVEAMKLFNEIEADINGEVVETLVGNGELVEYGQPLFRVKTV